MEMRFVCELKWDDLQGIDHKRRTCETCDKPVYNLSGMTRKQAATFVSSYGDKPPCVRFVTRNGEIVHNGDPFEQLARQRRGTKVLIGAALTVHLGIAGFSADPLKALVTPFNILAIATDDDCGSEVVGEMAVPEPEGIIVFPGEFPLFKDDLEVIAFARANHIAADEIAAKGGPAAQYEAYRALYRADVTLSNLQTQPIPADLEHISARAFAARDQLENQHRDFRVRHHGLVQRKKYEEISVLVKDYLSRFSDDHNSWARDAIDRQRDLIDAGHVPSNSAESEIQPVVAPD